MAMPVLAQLPLRMTVTGTTAFENEETGSASRLETGARPHTGGGVRVRLRWFKEQLPLMIRC